MTDLLLVQYSKVHRYGISNMYYECVVIMMVINFQKQRGYSFGALEIESEKTSIRSEMMPG